MKVYCYAYICPLLLITLFTACSGQDKSREKLQLSKGPFPVLDTPLNSQIAEYIRHIFQDKNGNLWFGTNGYGVVHYDGDSVSYFSNEQGFDGQQITGITEDLEKNIWFATDQGVVKYDWSRNDEGGKRFINYSDHQYFKGQRFWSIFADSRNNIWAGSVAGIFRFDARLSARTGTDGNDSVGQVVNWAPFELPYPEVTGEFITKATTWSITEDGEGNIWFSTNGYGAFKYDPSAKLRKGSKSFTQYSKKDGLTDNSVDHILVDRNGNIWFGTRYGGISRFDGKQFVNYTQHNSIGNDEVCVVYEDKAGNIWFSSEGYGVYRYTASPSPHVDTDRNEAGGQGRSLTNFSEKDGLAVRAVQAIFEDKEGRFWVGGGGGLYRYNASPSPQAGTDGNDTGGKGTFYNVTKNGPWK